MFSGLNKLRMSLVWMLLITLRVAGGGWGGGRGELVARAAHQKKLPACCTAAPLVPRKPWPAIPCPSSPAHPAHPARHHHRPRVLPGLQVQQHRPGHVVLVVRLVEEHVLAVTPLPGPMGGAGRVMWG